MPKLLRIHNRLIVGGPTLNVLNLTKHLQPDFETLLVVGEKDLHEKDASEMAKNMGIIPVVIPEMGRAIHPLKDYSSYWKLRKVIKYFKPDIVHTHAAKPGAVGRFAAATAKIPVIVHTYHGHVFHSYFSKTKTGVYVNIERALGLHTNALVAISPRQKEELSQTFRIARPDKFRVVPLGFDLSPFQQSQSEKRARFREQYGIGDEDIVIGIIGRLVHIKNHSLFLKALDFVLKHTTRKVRAFIIGDGETREPLFCQAAHLKIPYNRPGGQYDATKPLTFTSWRTDVDVINAGLDIICLTSLNEGTPVSLIEAQAANKAIVSTNVGGISDVVKHNQTGLLSDITNPDEFCSNLLDVVEDDELRAALGKNGSWVLEQYDVARLADDFRKLYYELLDNKGVEYVRTVFKEQKIWNF
ncbi:MAG: glycosyltransferase [Niabella sp.]